MKTMKLMSKFFMSFLTIMLFLGCSPEDGKDGADGTDGIDGADGNDGVDGADGETGTANVIYSDWISSEFASITAAEESEQLLVSLDVGDINPNEDAIIVYGRRTPDAIGQFVMIQLPYEFFNQNEVYRYRLAAGTLFNALYVNAHTTNGNTNLFTYFSDYRYIIIPGGNSISAKSSVNYKKMTYQEIITHFNIPE